MRTCHLKNDPMFTCKQGEKLIILPKWFYKFIGTTHNVFLLKSFPVRICSSINCPILPHTGSPNRLQRLLPQQLKWLLSRSLFFGSVYTKQKWCYIALKVVHWLVIIGEPLYLYQMVLCRTIRGAIEPLNHPREPLKNP